MNVRDFLCGLIRFPSISSTSNTNVTRHAAAALHGLGFEIEERPYVDAAGVSKLNIVAKRGGNHPETGGGFAFFGHTDVVPASHWVGPGEAFEPAIADGKLYGRGACDMKGPVAAMIAACDRVSEHERPVYVVLTGDEETGMQGAETVARESRFYREIVDHDVAGVIGEPTLGQVVHGHKGYAVWNAIAHGKAGHSATYEGESATLKIIPFLTEVRALADELESEPQYADTRFDPPTPTLNIILRDDSPALNITSPRVLARLFVRLAPDIDPKPLDVRLRAVANEHDVELAPLRTRAAFFRAADDPYVIEMTDLINAPLPSTVCYGTDGSCFGDVRRLLVCGPGSIDQAHTADEFITLDELDRGVDRFASMIHHFAG